MSGRLETTDDMVGIRTANLAIETIQSLHRLDAAAIAEVRELDELWEHEHATVEVAIEATPSNALPSHAPGAQIARRALDIVISAVAILVFLPLMLVIAVAVKLTSPGAALFVQARPGRGSVEFRMFKFRSMDDGADRAVIADDTSRRLFEKNDFKLDGDDARITPLGSILRRTSLDELPQLFNVLRGDMSIVGIRPLLPRQLEKRPVHDQQLFAMMRPGMTGLWQVEGRSNVSGDKRMELDRRYVETWSLWSDITIVARTPLAVLRASGAR